MGEGGARETLGLVAVAYVAGGDDEERVGQVAGDLAVGLDHRGVFLGDGGGGEPDGSVTDGGAQVGKFAFVGGERAGGGFQGAHHLDLCRIGAESGEAVAAGLVLDEQAVE